MYFVINVQYFPVLLFNVTIFVISVYFYCSRFLYMWHLNVNHMTPSVSVCARMLSIVNFHYINTMLIFAYNIMCNTPYKYKFGYQYHSPMNGDNLINLA